MNEQIKALEMKIDELYLQHTGRQAQIHHKDTPPEKRNELKKLDSSECTQYVILLNKYYRIRGLKYAALENQWQERIKT